MKRILITGENSYIGNSFERWIEKDKNKYQVTKISLRNENWKRISFSEYDVVLHVAALVHCLNVTKNMKRTFYEINCELAVNVAKKAKSDGVKQFVFLSTMSVYGESGIANKNIIVSNENHKNSEDLSGFHLKR